MNKPVFDEYNTILGRVDAVRVTRENMEVVAKWCGGEVRVFPILDTPEPEMYIKLTASNTHLVVEEDRAEVGEWIIETKDGDVFRAVYADKLFLAMVKDQRNVPQGFSDNQHEQIVKLMTQLMEYQDLTTQRGGTTEETAGAAELAALQVWHLLR